MRCWVLLFIHTADIHVGAFPHSVLREACIEAFKRISEIVLSENVKTVVIAGDLFESSRPSYELVVKVVRILKELKSNGVRVIATPGSHDVTFKGYGTLTLLSEVGLVTIPPFEEKDLTLILKPVEVDGVKFYGLPGFKGGKEIEYLERKRIVYRDFSENDINVLVAHTSLEIPGYNITDISKKYSAIKLSKDAYRALLNFRYVALGHIHFPVPIELEFKSTLAYPGAPIGRDANDIIETFKLRNTFNSDRRVLLVDVSTSPPKVKALLDDFGLDVDILTVDSISNIIRDVMLKLNDMHGKYKCLIVYTGRVSFDQFEKLRKHLNELARKHNVWIHVVHSTVEEDDTLSLLEGFKVDLSNIEALEREAIRSIVRKLGISVDEEKLLKLINILGREYPEGSKKYEFDEEVVEEAVKVLNEILFKGGGE